MRPSHHGAGSGARVGESAPRRKDGGREGRETDVQQRDIRRPSVTSPAATNEAASGAGRARIDDRGHRVYPHSAGGGGGGLSGVREAAAARVPIGGPGRKAVVAATAADRHGKSSKFFADRGSGSAAAGSARAHSSAGSERGVASSAGSHTSVSSSSRSSSLLANMPGFSSSALGAHRGGGAGAERAFPAALSMAAVRVFSVRSDVRSIPRGKLCNGSRRRYGVRPLPVRHPGQLPAGGPAAETPGAAALAAALAA